VQQAPKSVAKAPNQNWYHKKEKGGENTKNSVGEGGEKRFSRKRDDQRKLTARKNSN